MTTRVQFGHAIDQAKGVVPSVESDLAWVTVFSFEDSNAKDNPGDTELSEPGSTKFNTAGVQNFESVDQGVEAMLQSLSGANYEPWWDALRGSDTDAMLEALAIGGWAGTTPAIVVSYKKSLLEMKATVQTDWSKYSGVVVAGSATDENPPDNTGAGIGPGATVHPVANGNSSELERTESAASAQEAQLKRDTDSGKVQAARDLVAKIHTHLDEITDLLK